MPIKIPHELPAYKKLQDENIFVMSKSRAEHQDIRPLKIIILNIMPKKIETERTDGTDYGEPHQGRLRSNGNHSPSPHQPQPVAHEAEITHRMLHHSIHTDHQNERG